MALRGAYFIFNARVPIVIDLNGGLTANGTRITAWAQTEWNFATQLSAANQLWLIIPVPQTADTYTVQNIRSGTFLDLSGSSPNNRTPITGWANNNSNNQRWVIRKDISGFYKFQNVASRTFMDLLNGGDANGTLITGWNGQWDATGAGSHHQQWSLQRVSQTSAEVRLTLHRNPELAFGFKSYLLDADYIILPEGIWQTIWNGSGLRGRYRSEIFDCDDFAVVYKATLARWSADNIRADGIAILCGIIFARHKVDATRGHAYNFNLNTRFDRVRYFEPQTSIFTAQTEYNPVAGWF